ncbi:MAG: hypothetical protein IIB94_10775 [Candidatus Marinimicrobia bacterium]|nr:hypothetical protein [Candidatus Neomarinimicrobiota bacterium]
MFASRSNTVEPANNIAKMNNIPIATKSTDNISSFTGKSEKYSFKNDSNELLEF